MVGSTDVTLEALATLVIIQCILTSNEVFLH